MTVETAPVLPRAEQSAYEFVLFPCDHVGTEAREGAHTEGRGHHQTTTSLCVAFSFLPTPNP